MTNKSYEVILIGDTGDPVKDKQKVLHLLSQHLPGSTASAVVFLGDLIYPKGMPAVDHPLRADAERKLLLQLETVRDYKGRLIFISGNHDWNKGKKNGYEYMLRQERYIENYFNGSNVYLPQNGCPGPEVIYINSDLLLVVINTQWWVQKGVLPIGKEYNCKINSEEEFFEELRDVFEKNRDKRILLIGHLPLYSYGLHGGNSLLKHHVFPFTMYNKKAFIPLPFIGSLLPLYRKFIGAREDLAHWRYQRFRSRLKRILSDFNNIIYAAGHEHNLQYIHKNNNHFIISGSGSKKKFVDPGKYSHYAAARKGFFKLIFNEDKSVVAEAWTLNNVETPDFREVIIPPDAGGLI